MPVLQQPPPLTIEVSLSAAVVEDSCPEVIRQQGAGATPEQAAEQLVFDHLYIARDEAVRATRRFGGDTQVHYGHAVYGLWRAARRFGDHTGNFAAYAAVTCRWVIVAGMAEAHWLGEYARRQRARGNPAYRAPQWDRPASIEVLVGYHWDAAGPVDVEAEVIERENAREDRELIDRLLATLSDRHRSVIIGHYFDGKTLADLAPGLGVVPKAATDVHRRALALMRRAATA